MSRRRRTAEGEAALMGCWGFGADVRGVHAPEPPLVVGDVGLD